MKARGMVRIEDSALVLEAAETRREENEKRIWLFNLKH